MATVMSMHWPEVTKEQYEAARAEVRWETETPKGAKYHVSWFGDDGLHVFDVWDSAEDFQKFVETRLNPAVAKIGIKGEPKVTLAQAHAIFAPNPA
jgi:heme-degrading monooxygenase HmoA